MIKTSTLAAAILLLFSIACTKKDRTCSCTETKTGTSATHGAVTQDIFGVTLTLADTTFSKPVYEVRIYDRTINHATKKTAANNCVSYSEPYLDKTTTSVPSASFNLVVEVTDTGTKKYECSLK